MRALTPSERRKRGCDLCAYRKLKKIADAFRDGDTGIEYAINAIKTTEKVNLCPFAKCKFSELDFIKDYDEDYNKKMETKNGLL